MSPRSAAGAALCAVLVAVAAVSASAAAPRIPVRVHEHTGIRLTDVIWTGSRLLYMENTTNTIWAPGPPLTRFASMPKVVEETRCFPAPGRHGFRAGSLYCHSPDNVIYRVDATTGAVTTFAKLPDSQTSDGAIAFDTVGSFGYRLLAATGKSDDKKGGTVYAIDPGGTVTRVGAYSSPRGGGAENMVVAPGRFGSGSGRLFLTLDDGSHGAIVMMDGHGRAKAIAFLPDGPNPIVVVPRTASAAAPAIPRGLYFTDTLSTNVFFTPAASLAPYAGELIVGSELGGLFWAVAPNGKGFRTTRIPLQAPGTKLNLEGAVFVG